MNIDLVAFCRYFLVANSQEATVNDLVGLVDSRLLLRFYRFWRMTSVLNWHLTGYEMV